MAERKLALGAYVLSPIGCLIYFRRLAFLLSGPAPGSEALLALSGLLRGFLPSLVRVTASLADDPTTAKINNVELN